MNIGALTTLASKLGIQLNYQAIGTILSIWDKKAVELSESDVRSVIQLINPSPDEQLVTQLTQTIQSADGDTLASYLSDQDRVMSMASRIIYNDKRLIAKLERDYPNVPVKCPKCGHIDEISRAYARLDAAADGMVTVHCIECEASREIPYNSIALYGV